MKQILYTCLAKRFFVFKLQDPQGNVMSNVEY